MKNQNLAHKIDSLIEALKDIQVTSNTALKELEELKQNTSEHKRTQAEVNIEEQGGSTMALPRENHRSKTNIIKPVVEPSPNTNDRNTGARPPPQHTDSTGVEINVRDTVKILSTGLFRGDRGVVTKLGKACVSVKLPSWRTKNRKSINLRIIRIHV